MSRVLRSMTYRLIHNVPVWAIVLGLVFLEVFILFFGGLNGRFSECFANHATYAMHNHETETEEKVYVSFEEEDPLLVNKYTQRVYMGSFNFVPGQMNKYEVSISNCGSVSELLAAVLFLIFAADSVIVMVFFGEIFSDGAIRNMVAIKTKKVFVYLVSLFINAVMCLLMYILVFAVLAVCVLLAGFYPMIYAPAFITAVLIGLLVTIAVTSLFIFILFVDQNPLISFILCALLVAVSVLSFAMEVSWIVFERPYTFSEVQQKNFFEGGYKVMGEGEWYFPVDGFDLGRVYYPADDTTVDFMSDTPNPDYPNEKSLTVIRALYRANIMNYPCEIVQFFIYPMYRDGLFTRYAAFSAGYILILLTAGSYIVSKRNVD